MRTLSFAVTTMVLTMLVIMPISSRAETVIYQGNNATGILDLNVAGEYFDITFVFGPGIDYYGDPGTFTFDNEESSFAAANAIHDALNSAPVEIQTVGPNQTPWFYLAAAEEPVDPGNQASPLVYGAWNNEYSTVEVDTWTLGESFPLGVILPPPTRTDPYTWAVAGEPPVPPTCDSTHLDLCTSAETCISAGGYWYNNICNSSPQQPETCDSMHLYLCTSAETCSAAGGYWYNDTCNSSPRTGEETVIYEGNNAIGIQNLDVAGELFNITFEFGPGIDYYGDPGRFTFDNEESSFAAAIAIHDALNSAPVEIRTVGPNQTPWFYLAAAEEKVDGDPDAPLVYGAWDSEYSTVEANTWTIGISGSLAGVVVPPPTRTDSYTWAIEGEPSPPPPPTCDSTHLDLCTSAETCSAAGGYWYNNECNSSPPPSEDSLGFLPAIYHVLLLSK